MMTHHHFVGICIFNVFMSTKYYITLSWVHVRWYLSFHQFAVGMAELNVYLLPSREWTLIQCVPSSTTVSRKFHISLCFVCSSMTIMFNEGVICCSVCVLGNGTPVLEFGPQRDALRCHVMLTLSSAAVITPPTLLSSWVPWIQR